MKLTVLGSGSFIPTTKRNNSGFLVEVGNQNILLDLGPGIIRQLVKAGFDYKKINIVVISHFDADHINDLFSLIQLYNSPAGYPGKKELIVVGSFGLKQFLRGIGQFYEDAIPKADKLKLKIIEGGETDFGTFSIGTMPGKHAPSSVMIKIKQGEKELVYTGDTIYNKEIGKFTKNPELLVTECTSKEGETSNNHLMPSEAARMANLVSAKRLLLVHLAPGIDPADIIREVSRYYHGELIIAEDFLKVQF